jgi:hypothetical protein
MIISTLSHGGLQIVFVDKLAPISAGILRALFRMDEHSLVRSATPHSHPFLEALLSRQIDNARTVAEGARDIDAYFASCLQWQGP